MIIVSCSKPVPLSENAGFLSEVTSKWKRLPLFGPVLSDPSHRADISAHLGGSLLDSDKFINIFLGFFFSFS